MAIIRKIPWVRRPYDRSVSLEINDAHPFARGLLRAFLCNDGMGDTLREFVKSDHAIQNVGNPTAWLTNRRGRTFDFRTSGASRDGFNFTTLTFSDSQPWSIAFGIDRIDDGNPAHGALFGDGVDIGSDYINIADDGATDRVDFDPTVGGTTSFADTGITPTGYHDWVISSDGAGTGACTIRVHHDGVEFASASTRNGGIILTNLGDGRNSTALSFRGKLYYAYFYDWRLLNSHAQILKHNPYQIFQSRTQIIPIEVAAPVGGRIMSSLAYSGGLAHKGGIAGKGGGLAGQ